MSETKNYFRIVKDNDVILVDLTSIREGGETEEWGERCTE